MTEPTTDIKDPADPVAAEELPVADAADELPAASPAHEEAEDSAGFEFVRLPNGKVVAVAKDSIQEAPETVTQTVPAAAMVPVEDPHFYVWLANGDKLRVKQSDLPPAAGTNAQYGYWRTDDKVFLIVGVYPVETIVKGDQ